MTCTHDATVPTDHAHDRRCMYCGEILEQWGARELDEFGKPFVFGARHFSLSASVPIMWPFGPHRKHSQSCKYACADEINRMIGMRESVTPQDHTCSPKCGGAVDEWERALPWFFLNANPAWPYAGAQIQHAWFEPLGVAWKMRRMIGLQ